ncbi:CsbD family protein [Hoeflea sp. Naph1]|uniref:CsbD family protein n=1 Tax=Hoeflea sp. Naph1 TaxID=3388653 RepID=UPI0039901805
MNWDIVEGKWNEYKGKAQAQWGRLTNDDLDVVEGRRDELAGKIQARYGKTRDDAEREIDEWLGRS